MRNAMLAACRHPSHWLLPLLLVLSGCATREMLHEFPPELALPARSDAAVNYTLVVDEDAPERWELLGGQNALVASFSWEAHIAEASGSNVREDRVLDGVNGRAYVFRYPASIGRSSVYSEAMIEPRVNIHDAENGARIGQIDLRLGYQHRIEGTWRDRNLLWQIRTLESRRVERDTEEGKVEDVYPAAQLIEWTVGSDSGLKIYAGRKVKGGETQEFGMPVFEMTAERPLTRAELGDVVVLLFATLGLQQPRG